MPLYRKFYLVVVVVVCAAFSLFTQIDSRCVIFFFSRCAISKHRHLTQTVCETQKVHGKLASVLGTATPRLSGLLHLPRKFPRGAARAHGRGYLSHVPRALDRRRQRRRVLGVQAWRVARGHALRQFFQQDVLCG